MTNNYKGRKKGSTNVVNRETKQAIQFFLEENQENFTKWLNETTAIQKVNTYLALLPFILPKLRTVEVIEPEPEKEENDLSCLTDDEVNTWVGLVDKVEEHNKQ